MSDPSPPSSSSPGPGWPPPGQAGQPPQPGPPPQPGQQQPPPGYGPPAGYGPPSGGVTVGIGLWLGLAAIVAMALAVSLNEDGDNGWGRIGVWAAFAIVAAVATLAPALGRQLNLSTERAWQVGAAGAAGLAGFWVLFVLPSISQNTSFLATVACAAGIGAAWIAPGRPSGGGDASAQGEWW